ncbi:Pol polyprotein [Plakobranchus ocellatus]|uniref:Pol polyprotein n=1 Tax=Plakobranchus ocellatus TaxID=259542 RepID=A0AAV3ZPK8_9GAST|nr:Pol polyprotein [Plakobranchus ocellatus]
MHNYSSRKLELLALKWAVTVKFRSLLLGSQFSIFTDNNTLCHLHTAKLGAIEQLWQGELAAFDFDIIYRPGKHNTIADTLSRYPVAPIVDDIEDFSNQHIGLSAIHESTYVPPFPAVFKKDIHCQQMACSPQSLSQKHESTHNPYTTTPFNPSDSVPMPEQQEQDTTIQPVCTFLCQRRKPNLRERAALPRPAQALLTQGKRLRFEDDVLMRIVVGQEGQIS